MTMIEFLLSGTNPASIAGMLLILISAISIAISRSVAWPTLVSMLFGGVLCAINYVEVVRFGKDGVELSTRSGKAIIDLSKEVDDNNRKIAATVDNLNSQIAAVGATQKELVEKVTRLAQAGVDPASNQTLGELNRGVEEQNNRLIGLYKQNELNSKAIASRSLAVQRSVQSLNEALTSKTAPAQKM